MHLKQGETLSFGFRASKTQNGTQAFCARPFSCNQSACDWLRFGFLVWLYRGRALVEMYTYTYIPHTYLFFHTYVCMRTFLYTVFNIVQFAASLTCSSTLPEI